MGNQPSTVTPEQAQAAYNVVSQVQRVQREAAEREEERKRAEAQAAYNVVSQLQRPHLEAAESMRRRQEEQRRTELRTAENARRRAEDAILDQQKKNLEQAEKVYHDFLRQFGRPVPETAFEPVAPCPPPVTPEQKARLHEWDAHREQEAQRIRTLSDTFGQEPLFGDPSMLLGKRCAPDSQCYDVDAFGAPLKCGTNNVCLERYDPSSREKRGRLWNFLTKVVIPLIEKDILDSKPVPPEIRMMVSADHYGWILMGDLFRYAVHGIYVIGSMEDANDYVKFMKANRMNRILPVSLHPLFDVKDRKLFRLTEEKDPKRAFYDPLWNFVKLSKDAERETKLLPGLPYVKLPDSPLPMLHLVGLGGPEGIGRVDLRGSLRNLEIRMVYETLPGYAAQLNDRERLAYQVRSLLDYALRTRGETVLREGFSTPGEGQEQEEDECAPDGSDADPRTRWKCDLRRDIQGQEKTLELLGQYNQNLKRLKKEYSGGTGLDREYERIVQEDRQAEVLWKRNLDETARMGVFQSCLNVVFLGAVGIGAAYFLYCRGVLRYPVFLLAAFGVAAVGLGLCSYFYLRNHTDKKKYESTVLGSSLPQCQKAASEAPSNDVPDPRLPTYLLQAMSTESKDTWNKMRADFLRRLQWTGAAETADNATDGGEKMEGRSASYSGIYRRHL